MTRKEVYAQAHKILDALLDVEPGRERADDLDRWKKSVRRRLRAENWNMIVAELETGASPEAIIATISRTASPPAAPAAPQPPTFTASERPTASPVDRELARNRIAQIRESLGVTR